MSTTQGIKLDDDTQTRLKSLAAKRNRTPHWLMRSAIEDYLNREEQYEQEKSEDMKRWEQYLITGKYIDNEKMEDLLGDLSSSKKSVWPA
jgi:predicted transcriptional regulator